MNSAQRLTPVDRDRALERLRRLSTGVAVSGLSATLGFGWMAAASNPGSSASVATTTQSATTTTQSAPTTTQSVPTTTVTTDDSGQTDVSGSTGASTFGDTSLGSTSVGSATITPPVTAPALVTSGGS